MFLNGKTLLITGGTGSFGNKFADVALAEHSPSAIRIYSRDELKQLNMSNKFQGENRIRFFIGDVRDRSRLSRAMNDVDIVIHAAALKQVPACEYNPIEAVRTNIEGAMNIIEAAIENKVEKVIALSTDKAVHPVNLYGATKLVAEKIFIQGNAYSGVKRTRFSCVRYGNVVGSRGSVVPLFIHQKDGGRITITDEKMTRFWITLEQGVRFVMSALDKMHGGEIFVPKIPSMEILDLADVVAPNCDKQIVGIRPGEKIHEVLITEQESRHTKEFEEFYVIEPNFPFWKRENFKGGNEVADGFRYTSNSNSHWLTKDELSKMIEEL